MAAKRKDKENNHDTPAKNKRLRQEKPSDFSDDENLSDIDDGGEIFNGIYIPPELPPIISAEEKPGPRMIIKNIVANNFKSYYGEVTIGPFHKSLTSIVGANGSGKSNVIDSLLFVFGYRSSKIRSKKVSVLIHKSDKHKDVSQCSVTVNFVHIQDDDIHKDDFITIPDSEITITRTAFKDNTSYYTLNNKRVKFKEIAIILKKNGIDLIHNRFLILQGEVEQIAMMKPKAENEHSTGMLEYLEDVIGTVRYKKPIYKLDEKVKDLSCEKNEKIARLKTISKDREELIEPVEEIIRYFKLENQKVLWDNKYQQKILFDENKIIETEKQKHKEIKDKLKSIDNELKAIEKSKKDKVDEINILSEKVNSDIETKEKFEKKLKDLINNKTQFKAYISDAKNEINKFESSIKQEQKKVAKAEGIPKIKEAEHERLLSQTASLKEECLRLEANYSTVNSNGYKKSKNIREERDLLDPKEKEKQNSVYKKQNKLKSLKTEFEVLVDGEKSEKDKLSNLEKELLEAVDRIEENTKRKEQAELDISVHREKIEELERNVKKYKSGEQEIQNNLQNIRQSLSEKRTAYAETTERSRPILYILSLKDKGEIRGLLGRCGDYGQVEGKFDIPACTACGSVDQIVVETSDAAHACIQKLRTNNIGRLTFSILPQVQKLKPRADSNNNYPENAKRVFDLIQILDQNFRLTFYSGLYDTLLAENLEQARRLAFGTKIRYRVVTFNGDLIDQSGIMSGGGKPIKGKIGPQETRSRYAGGNTSQVSQKEVEKLDKIVKDLEAKLRETQSNIYDFQSSIENHHTQIKELNMVIKECLSRISATEKTESKVKKLIETQKLVIVESKTDPIAVANKEAEIKKIEKELEETLLEYNEIKTKLDNLTKQIADITEEEPREAKRLLDNAVDNLQKNLRDIAKINVDIESAERRIKIAEDNIKSFKDNIERDKKKIETNTKKLEEVEDSIIELKEKVDQITTSIVEQKKNIQEIENKENNNMFRISELRKDRIPLIEEEDEIKNLISKHKAKCAVCEKKLSEFKLHKIPKININQRDPVMESYLDSNIKNKETDAVNGKNLNENKAPLETSDTDQTNDDDGFIEANKPNYIYDKVFRQYTNEELESCTQSDIQLAYVIYSEQVKNLNPNLKILEEFNKKTKQYNDRADEVTSVLKNYNAHNDMLNKVRQRRRDEFMASFRKITIKLKEMYQMITLGGDAELELVDSLDPFSEGVNFSVRPPKKTWKVISNLSGGEKTLSSLALVFALHYYKPSPLYVMDEIDAALDFKNVSIIAYYIKERTKNSQFIIISLRSNMFEKANLLVGIYKTNDCTATTSINTSYYKNVLSGALAKKGN